MKPKLTAGLALAALILFVFRHDWWLRENATIVVGLPVSLLFHLVFCGLVSAVFALFLYRKSRT